MYDIDKSETIKLLSELIRIESVNPSLVQGGSGEREIARFVSDYLSRLGLKVIIEDTTPGRPNVVGHLRGSGNGKTLMLNGHLDTVGLEGMTIEPLNPVMKDGLMFGRGALDMKGGIAAMLAATRGIVESGVQLGGDLVVAGVCDEEYMSIGTEYLVRSLKTDAAIVVEPTALQVVTAHKGFVWIDIETHGVAAHGSSPAQGVDAITEMAKFLVALDQFQERTMSKRTHPLVGSPSVHASIISGGRELSTYPERCRLQIERRMIPGENVADVEREVAALFEKVSKSDPKFKAEYSVRFARGAMEVPSETEICQTLMACIATVNGRVPQIAGVSYWLDSEIIWRSGIPVVVFGPSGAGAHAAVEYVDISSVLDVARVLKRTALQFCSSH